MNKMMNNIFCIKWGDKYDDSYVGKTQKTVRKTALLILKSIGLHESIQLVIKLWTTPTIRQTLRSRQGLRYWYQVSQYIIPLLIMLTVTSFFFLTLMLSYIKTSNISLIYLWINLGLFVGGGIIWRQLRRTIERKKSTPLNSSVIRWNTGFR